MANRAGRKARPCRFIWIDPERPRGPRWPDSIELMASNASVLAISAPEPSNGEIVTEAFCITGRSTLSSRHTRRMHPCIRAWTCGGPFPRWPAPWRLGIPARGVFADWDPIPPRACLKNDNMPKGRIFFRVALPNFLEIHKVFLRKFVFATRKDLSPLCTSLFIKQALVHFRQICFSQFYYAHYQKK